jgi:hypothetical protein
MRRTGFLTFALVVSCLCGCDSGGGPDALSGGAGGTAGRTAGSGGGTGGMSGGAGGTPGRTGGSSGGGTSGGTGGSGGGTGSMSGGAGGAGGRTGGMTGGGTSGSTGGGTAGMSGGTGGATGGTGGGGGVCEELTPCGGDIAPGTYRVTSYCEHAEAPEGSDPSCPGKSVSTTSSTLSGTFTFSAGQGYSFATTGSGSQTLRVPVSCLTQGGGPMTCSSLAQEMQHPSSDDPSFNPYTSVNCTGSTVCTCVATADIGSSETGSYSVDNSLLTTVPDGPEPGTVSPYCVSGNQIILGEAQCGTSCAGPTGTVRMVLTRQ